MRLIRFLGIVIFIFSSTLVNATTIADMPITTSFSYLFGGEQDFRNTDHATLLTNGLEMNNVLAVNQNVYVALDNQIGYGFGFYYITNPYSAPNKYDTTGFKYSGRVTAGYLFALPHNNTLALGLGGGYRYLYYKSQYNQPFNPNAPFVNGVSTVEFLYNEFYIPIEINFHTDMNEKFSFTFNNIIAMGIHGLVKHIFNGPGGFTQPSYHNTIGIYPTLLINYNNFSFGPWGSFDFFTLGKYNGQNTVPPGNEFKIVEFGLKASYTMV